MTLAEQIRESLAVAVSEMRSARRLVRTWLFFVLVVLFGSGVVLTYSVMHGLGSGYSASIGTVHPRFLFSGAGFTMLWILLLALVFLAFDIRARDTRERMAEVLDSRPVGNLALLGGRLLGLVALAWIGLLVMVLLALGFGHLARANEWVIGEPPELLSVFALATIDALPWLTLWCSLLILLAVVLRYRLAIAVAGLALAGGMFWGFTPMPFYLMPVFYGLTNYTLASDVVPHFAHGVDYVQRTFMLLGAGGFLALAAALHPRPDAASRGRQLAAGGGLVVLAVAGIAWLAMAAGAGVREREAWRDAHAAAQQAPKADVVTVSGTVTIEPGDALTLELVYGLKAATPLDELLFSLNPGMRVASVTVDGAAAEFSHDNGLLRVAPGPSVAAGAELVVGFAASGAPDPRFGYLDSVLDLPRLTQDAAMLNLLGIEASIFDSDYVALMPATFWMPMPGAATGQDGPHGGGRDFFLASLHVQAPADWLVAGPGYRTGSAGDFRFASSHAVPQVALLAGPFERHAAKIAYVDVELLMHPKHGRNVEFFADAGAAIRERAKALIDVAHRLGLQLPVQLSVVEVPARLRGFGGGWRMASEQAQPGIVLLREYGFPTSRFEVLFDDEEHYEDQEGGLAAAKASVLETHFANDVSGGNLLHGAVRNLVSFRTSAKGEGAVAVNFLAHELAVELVTGANGFFSPYLLSSSASFGATVQETMLGMVTGQAVSVGNSVYRAATRAPSVWDEALRVPLADLQAQDADDGEAALNVLWLKGPTIAQSIIEVAGREAVAAFLADLVARYRGRNFTAREFEAVARENGVDLPLLVGDWLHETALPGFLASPVRVFRLADDDRGEPRYQASVHVRNDEPVPGVVHLSLTTGDRPEQMVSHSSRPVRVGPRESVEVGVVLPAPPSRAWLGPLLSLNREGIELPLPEVDESAVAELPPLQGARPSDWLPPDAADIVIDDLDPGFAVAYEESGGGVRLSGGLSGQFAVDVDVDQGLPVHQPFAPVPQWSRQELGGAWGRYRHTLARVPAGEGGATATFSAVLPSAGRWRLDYHLPRLRSGRTRAEIAGGTAGGGGVQVNVGFPMPGLGSLAVRLSAGGTQTPVAFDAGAAEDGWNKLGEFELPAGPVDVAITNETSGQVVVVDALRWRRVDG